MLQTQRAKVNIIILVMSSVTFYFIVIRFHRTQRVPNWDARNRFMEPRIKKLSNSLFSPQQGFPLTVLFMFSFTFYFIVVVIPDSKFYRSASFFFATFYDIHKYVVQNILRSTHPRIIRKCKHYFLGQSHLYETNPQRKFSSLQ